MALLFLRTPRRKELKYGRFQVLRQSLKHIHPSYRKAITEISLSLRENPRPKGYFKLKGFDHLFRVRVGPYRIIYTIQDDRLIVLVLEIGDRKEIYRNY